MLYMVLYVRKEDKSLDTKGVWYYETTENNQSNNQE